MNLANDNPFVSVMPPLEDSNPGWSSPGALPGVDPNDPWAKIAAAYGLGAPPAQGMPATLPGVTVGKPDPYQFDQKAYLDLMNQINGQIGGAYGYQTPQGSASLIDQFQVPQGSAQQMGTSAELQRLLSGEGYTPEMLTRMRATATQQPAQAGLQQMSQMKRALGDAGIQGGAAAALQGEVARQTGQAQGQALRDVDLTNANAGIENQRFGVGQQTQIGLSNMQQANQMAMANANMLFQALSQNANASNQMTMMNTQGQQQQRLSGANAQAGFLGQQGAQAQEFKNAGDMWNTNANWQAKQNQTGLDWDRQTRQWDELNRRFSQSQNLLGSFASSGG